MLEVRKANKYQVQCRACRSYLRFTLGDLRLTGREDQRMTCPACGNAVLVVRDGFLAEDVEVKVYDRSWEDCHGHIEQSES